MEPQSTATNFADKDSFVNAIPEGFEIITAIVQSGQDLQANLDEFQSFLPDHQLADIRSAMQEGLRKKRPRPEAARHIV